MYDFSTTEILKIIVSFYMNSTGLWKDLGEDNSAELKFIKSGYAELYKEYSDVYKKNEKGNELINEFINKIEKKFISFMYSNRLKCNEDEFAEWFCKEYKVEDRELTKDFIFYSYQYMNKGKYYIERSTDIEGNRYILNLENNEQ